MTQPFHEAGHAQPGHAQPDAMQPRPAGRLYQPPRFVPTSHLPSYGPQQVSQPGPHWPDGYAYPYQDPYGYPEPYGRPPRRGNGMAVAGFVLSFLVGLLGLIFSIIGFRRSREPGRGGRGLAIAGIVISTLNLLAGALLVATASGSSGATGNSSTSVTAGGSSAAAPPVATAPVSTTTVPDACHVIIPAATGAQADLQTADSEAEMMQKVNTLADTIRQQGAASGDNGFAQDAANLADQYRALVRAVESGRKPDFSALEKAAEQIGYDCGKVGVTG
jgi:hypothetical protein